MMHWPCQWTKDSYRKKDGTGFCFTDIHRCNQQKIYQTWKAMEGLVKKGLTKSISVSNFNQLLLESLLNQCEIRPLTNEMEMHPYLQEDDLVEYCKRKGIQLVAYCPLVSFHFGLATGFFSFITFFALSFYMI